jgi:hypothetical protein
MRIRLSESAEPIEIPVTVELASQRCPELAGADVRYAEAIAREDYDTAAHICENAAAALAPMSTADVATDGDIDASLPEQE